MTLPPPVLTSADIAAVNAQPTAQGRTLSALAVDPEGNLLPGWGDWAANTGPMTIFTISEAGVVTSRLTNWDNEAVTSFHVADDGTVYSPPTDPKNNGVAQLALCPPGGQWTTIPVSVPGVSNAEHMFGVTTEDGAIITCGSHSPDTAFVWESTDGGVTWTEEVAHTTGIADGYLRFYGFWYDSQNRLTVSCYDSLTAATYKRISGVWVKTSDTYEPSSNPWQSGPGEPYIDGNSPKKLRLSDGTVLGILPDPVAPGYWTARFAADGVRIWLCDGVNVYLYDPTT